MSGTFVSLGMQWRVRAPCLGKHTVWETEITQVNKQAVTSWWGAVRKRQGEGWKCFDGDDV